jgi:transposase InsO family protein
MKLIMDTTHIPTLKQMAVYVSGDNTLKLRPQNKLETYGYVAKVLVTHKYASLAKPQKTAVKQYLLAVSGYSSAQIERLISQYVRTGKVTPAKRTQPTFQGIYTKEDITILAKLDEVYERMSGSAMTVVLRREYEKFGNKSCQRLKDISASHIYNLRGTNTYKRINTTYTKTKPTTAKLGERIKPQPLGKPGYLRADTEHQGDKDGEKGVYHINLVDEVTQWEVVVCVRAITDQYMLPAIRVAMESFPFVILNFHADNGSEYINRKVADMLNKGLVKLTKSRPRHSGDNGLVETKNGVVLRKHMGYIHIPRTNDNAEAINRFYINWFIPWLNYHRPCAFRKTVQNEKTGKITHTYPTENYMMPYVELKSLMNAEQYLKPGITFDQLDMQAYAMCNSQWTIEMQLQKQAMWDEIKL